MRNTKIILFDEATSALDNESERFIQDSLEKLAHGRTTITIAHRLSTILGADEIIVLDSEGIRERGTHKELIKQDGIYEKYYRMQLSAI
jgi:ATP-binding cassette subfamily B protein